MSLKIGDLVGGGLGGALRGTVAGLGSQVADKLVNALFMSGRSIGGIVPDVTIEEHHTDTLTITEHPVEKGSTISDHAFKNPAEVTMRAAWSNSASIANSFVSGSIFSGSIANVNDLYRKLLDLQASREVFDLVTGKRTYSNMLVKSLSVTTDKDTENALVATAIFKQINIVETAAAALAPPDAHASPQDTADATDGGTKQPIKAQNQSALSSAWDAIKSARGF